MRHRQVVVGGAETADRVVGETGMEMLEEAGSRARGAINAMWEGRASRLRIVCHDGEEFLLIDFTILVEIKLVYHGLARRGGYVGLAQWTGV